MDKREEILLKEFDVSCEDCRTWAQDIQLALAVTLNPDISKIKNAMDEYMKATCLELLEYMADSNVRISHDFSGQPIFEYKGKCISKEQLFENFL